MKRLILIGGPMGVGKTTAGRALQQLLPNCAFLDGDWCWDIRPFTVNGETKALALDNIRHLLNGFLRCAAVESVVFCWVMHEREIVDAVLDGLDLANVEVRHFTLLASPETLTARLLRDVEAGLRTPDVVERSLSRLSACARLDGERLSTDDFTPEQVAMELLRLCKPI